MSTKKKKPGNRGPGSAKQRNKLGPIQPPPVFGTKKAPPAAPHAIARQLIESRSRPAKVFDLKAFKQSGTVKSVVGGYASNTVGSPASIAELARALKNDVDLIFEHVYNNINFEATFGSQRGPVGTLLDGYGNAFDQAELMVALCREAGYTADLVFGQVRLDYGPIHDWLGTEPTNLLPAYWLLSNAGIPADLTYIYPDYVIDVTHCWVRVEIDSTYYYFDPALKVHEEIAGINLATAMDYDSTEFMDDATDGATQTADYIEDINRTNIRANLDTLTGNLVDYIKTNAHGAKVDEIVGGRRIVPQSGQVRDTEHPYLKPESEPDIWSDIPNAYKCTLRVQYDTIDETFYSQDIYGKRFTLFFNGSHEAELRLDGALIATSDAQGTGTWNSMLLTAEHPYSWGWADQYAYYRIWADKYYVIANAWGTGGRAMVEEHRRRLEQALFDGGADTDEDVLGETLSIEWYTLNALGGMNNDIVDRMTNCRTAHHHQIGVVEYYDTPAMDISMVVKTSANLDLNWDGPNVSATTSAMHGVANEAACSAQTYNVVSASTTTLVDVAANAGQKIYYADSGNWTSDVEPNLVNYDTGTKTDIESVWINNGYVVVLPEDGEVTLEDWQGYAYYVIPPYPYSGAIGIIGGGLKGKRVKKVVTPEEANDETVKFLAIWKLKDSDTTKSDEPIGMFTGDFLSEKTDLTVGSAPAPYGLAFTRFYNSKNRLVNGTLGLGWKHNFDFTAHERVDGFLAYGQETALAAAAGIVEMFVCVDLMSDLSKPLEKILATAVANAWLVDQMTANTVVIKTPTSADVFAKLPNGDYVSAIGSANELTKDGDEFTLTTPQKVDYNFNADGQLATIVHPFGMTTTLTYVSDKLDEVDTGLGRTLEFTYTGDKLTSITDGNSRTVVFDYTDEDLTTVTDPDSEDIVYEYDIPGRLTKVFMPQNPMDEFVTNVYDTLGRVQTQTDAENNTWEYFFAGARSEEKDPETNSKVYYFDRNGNTTRSIDALGSEVTKEFDGNNRLVKSTMPEGNSVEYSYDVNNNVLEITAHPKPGSGLIDIVQTFTYDSVWNRVETVEDGRGNVTTFDYDNSTGQLLSILQPEVDSAIPESVFTYDAYGRLETATDPTGIVDKYNWSESDETLEAFVHDEGMGRLNLTTQYGYDSVGNADSVIDARGNETSKQFNSLRQLESVTAPSPFTSQVTEFQYDANGNCTVRRHSTGDVLSPWQTYQASYTKANQVEFKTDPMTHVRSFGYDTLRRLNSVEDPEERVTEMDHDARGQVYIVEDAANNTVATNSYTDNGLIQSILDPRSNETLYEYDGFDRLKKITYADSSFEEFDWDENGNLVSFTNRAGEETVFEYDELNRLRVKTPDNLPEVTFDYDPAGRVQTISTTPVMGEPGSGEFQYGYDTAGRLTSEEMPDSKTVSYDLDEVGNVIKITFPDSYYVEREFDEINRLKSITLNGAMTPTVEFEYDDLSRRKKITFGNGVETDFTYRDDNQVESISHTFDGSSVLFEYTYNDAGDLIGQEVNDADFMWHPGSSGTTSYGTASDINTYPTVGGDTYSYNDNGCLEDNDTWAFTYDQQNRLTSADDGGTSIDFLYDPQNRQVQKSIGASKSRFLYAGFQRIAEYDENGDLVNRFVYGNGLDDILLQIAPNGDVTYLHHDRLGSVVGTSDAGGDNTAKVAYGPFGETDGLSGISHGYTGQCFDSETGLYYYRARHYNPNTGSFVQPDPAVRWVNVLNSYAYVSNNPLNLTDPLGLLPVPPQTVFMNKVVDYLNVLAGMQKSEGIEHTLAVAFDSNWNVLDAASSNPAKSGWGFSNRPRLPSGRKATDFFISHKQENENPVTHERWYSSTGKDSGLAKSDYEEALVGHARLWTINGDDNIFMFDPDSRKTFGWYASEGYKIRHDVTEENSKKKGIVGTIGLPWDDQGDPTDPPVVAWKPGKYSAFDGERWRRDQAKKA